MYIQIESVMGRQTRGYPI